MDTTGSREFGLKGANGGTKQGVTLTTDNSEENATLGHKYLPTAADESTRQTVFPPQKNLKPDSEASI